MLSVAFETVSTVRGHHQPRSSTAASEQPNNGFAGLVDNNLAAADQVTATPAKPATNTAAPASQQPVASAIKNDDANDRQAAPAIDVSDQNKTPVIDPIVASTAPTVATAPAVAPENADAPDDAPNSADADLSAAGDTPATPAVGVAPPQPPVATAIATPATPLPSPAVPAPSQDAKPAVDEIGAAPATSAGPQPAETLPAAQTPIVTSMTSDASATMPAAQIPSPADTVSPANVSTTTQPQPQTVAAQTAALTSAAANEPAFAATVALKADLPAAGDPSNKDQPKAAVKAAATPVAASAAGTSSNEKLSGAVTASDDSFSATTSTVAGHAAPTSSDQQKTAETQAKPDAADKSAQTARKDAEPTASAAQDRSPQAATTTIVTHNLLTGATTTLQSATTLHATGAMTADASQTTTTLNVSVANSAAVPLGALGVEIASNLQGGRSRFEIRLDPAELGRIDVRLDIDKNGQVTSHLAVEKPATLDMLRREAPQLERALNDAGFKTSGDGLQFSLRDQSSSGRNDDDRSRQKSQHLTISEDDIALRESVGRNYGRLSGVSGGLDIRV